MSTSPPKPSIHVWPLPYEDRLEQRPDAQVDLVVIHCTELPDLATAREYGERGSRSGVCPRPLLHRSRGRCTCSCNRGRSPTLPRLQPRSSASSREHRSYPAARLAHQEMTEAYHPAQLRALVALLLARRSLTSVSADRRPLGARHRPVAASDDRALQLPRKRALARCSRAHGAEAIGLERLQPWPGGAARPYNRGTPAPHSDTCPNPLPLLRPPARVPNGRAAPAGGLEDNLFPARAATSSQDVFAASTRQRSRRPSSGRAGRSVHSIPSTLRAGDITAPIIFTSIGPRRPHFSVRRVTAIQHGQPIWVRGPFQKTERASRPCNIPRCAGGGTSSHVHLLRNHGQAAANMQRWLSRMDPSRCCRSTALRGPPERPLTAGLFGLPTSRDDPELHQALLSLLDFYCSVTTLFPRHQLYTERAIASRDTRFFSRPFRVETGCVFARQPDRSHARWPLARPDHTLQCALVASVAHKALSWSCGISEARDATISFPGSRTRGLAPLLRMPHHIVQTRRS